MPRLTREQLFDLIWSKPMTQVAAKLGISDVGLKKICRRHRIPAPFRGYWARVAAGHQPPRPTLPTPRKGEHDLITIRDRKLASAVLAAEQEARAREEISENSITVGTDLNSLGLFAAKLLRALQRTARDYRGIVTVTRSDGLSVALAPTNAERAALLLDGLYKAAESHGHRIARGGNLIVGGATLRLQLQEKVENVPLKPGIKGRPSRIPSYMRWKQRNDPEWDFKATGRLVLTLVAAHGEGIRRSWSDGKHQRLEACLNAVLASAAACSAAEKVWKEVQARRAVECEGERARHIDTERLHYRETQRWEFLDRCANELERAERAERFLAHLEASAPAVYAADAPLARFLRWTRERCIILRRNASAAAVSRALAEAKLFEPEDQRQS